MNEQSPNDWAEISRGSFDEILDCFFDFYAQRYHRADVGKVDFLEEVFLGQVTLGITLFQWVEDWRAKEAK